MCRFGRLAGSQTIDRQSRSVGNCFLKEHLMRAFLFCLLSLPLAAQVTNRSKPTTGVVPDRVYATASRPKALALIGDIYHGPVLMRDGLITALVRENIPVTFIEDPAELNAKSLSECSLLIIARNGRYWPEGYGKPQTAWMTGAQQKAVWDFVNNGGGFLAVHNAHTMYPKGGLYYTTSYSAVISAAIRCPTGSRFASKTRITRSPPEWR